MGEDTLQRQGLSSIQVPDEPLSHLPWTGHIIRGGILPGGALEHHQKEASGSQIPGAVLCQLHPKEVRPIERASHREPGIDDMEWAETWHQRI